MASFHSADLGFRPELGNVAIPSNAVGDMPKSALVEIREQINPFRAEMDGLIRIESGQHNHA